MNNKKNHSSVIKRKKNKSKLSYELTGLFLLFLGVFVIISILGFNTGVIGDLITQAFSVLFGILSIIPAIGLVVWGGYYTLKASNFSWNRKLLLAFFSYFLIATLYTHIMVPTGYEFDMKYITEYGGIIGSSITWSFRWMIGEIGTTILITLLLVIDILFLTKWSLSSGVQKISKKTEEKLILVKKTIKEKSQTLKKPEFFSENEEESNDFLYKSSKKKHIKEKSISEVKNQSVKKSINETLNDKNEELDKDDSKEIKTRSGYKFPPIELLHKSIKISENYFDIAKEKADLLEKTLKSFGVSAKVINISIGPSVTRFEIEPAPGVKVRKIENLSDDIALQLAATQIRIEAPIPGKSAVGIEIPNEKNSEVALRDVLEDNKFKHGKGNILVALGKDIAGNAVVADLSKMPHLLIAGATGSGKSVCINTLITSILYNSSPDDVKLILIDPKVVELSIYNGIPHLRIDVVTDPKKAAGALNWAVREMEHRYKLFSENKVRDIKGFNIAKPELKLPYMVIIIDELADLMMVASDSVEDSICRLAQKARAAGIHLVLATQRPSVDVITGVIKANIPSRISFAVSSQIDSRTILDRAGAEKLLGKGDMLFDPSGVAYPIRVQGAFITDKEVENITNFIKENSSGLIKLDNKPIDLSIPEIKEIVPFESQQDELLGEAAEWILDTKRASVSALQRRFRIGYTRAGRLMDTMEAMGIVSGADGAKPREILISKNELEIKLKNT